MKYVLKLNIDHSIDIVEIPKNKDYKWYSREIGCDWIEIVRPKYSKYVLVVDEEGRLKDNHINLFASSMYGTFEHGEPIVGTCLLMDEGIVHGEPDLVGLNYDEALKIKAELENELINAKQLNELMEE